MKTHGLLEKGMNQWRIVLTFTLILVAYGVYSFLTMQRQEFPTFTIRQGLVVGVMPGASTEEVEEQLTQPVEDYLFSFNEINKEKTYSVTKEGQTVVYVELNDSIDAVEAPAFWAKLRHGLNELKAQKLSNRVLALIGNNDFGDTSALLFTMTAEGRSPRDLKEYTKVLQSHLRRIEATSKLRTLGEQQEVILVNLSGDKLSRYGIRPASVWSSLQGFGDTPAPARLDEDDLERPIHLKKVIRSESELAETILLSLPSGEYVRLKDVADIRREYGRDDSYVRYNGKTALMLSIEMQSGNDITHFGDEVDKAVAAARAELPAGVTIERVADQPKVVRTSVNQFLKDFGLAIVSVILVTMLLLPMRVASVAALTIPISIAITFGVLNAFDVQLQTVSLAGLIVVLGMIVDNSIVVIDDHVDKLDRGMDPRTAAWKSAKELAVPVVTATFAIILSYVPQAIFVKGTAGDFLRSLPATVASALIASMAVVLLLLPVMNSQLIKKGLHKKRTRRSMLDVLQAVFDRALKKAFRHPALTILVGIASIVAAGYIGTRIQQQMFPKIDRNQFAVEVYLPDGRSLKETDGVVSRLEKELLADKRIVNVTAFVGQGSPRFHTIYAPHMPARNFGQLLVNTTDAKATEEVLRDYRKRLAGAFPNAWVRWKQLEFSVGFPVEVRLSGDNIQALKEVASKIEAYAKTVPGTTWVHNDYEEPMQTIEITPDADKCAQLGVPPAMIQASLAIATQGLPVATIWEGDYPVKVLAKDESGDLFGVKKLREQYVSSMFGASTVSLEQLASLSPGSSGGAIVRRNGVRTLSVLIDIDMNTLASSVQKQMEQYIATLHTPGVRIDYGGEVDLIEMVMPPMTTSMIVSIGLIFLVILIQFQRFRKALVVMMAMPLSLFGGVVGLLIMHYPFGLTAFMGIIGLMGLVVRNGIILVTYAEELRAKGMPAMEAAFAAGKRRMRPIYLTSMAAAIGVLPMVIGRSTLWGPLGTVTCFGLVIAMIITLFVLPVTYGLIMHAEDKKRERDGNSPKPDPDGSSTTPESTGASSGASVSGAAAIGLILLTSLTPARATADEKSLTLAEAERMALENNAKIQESELEIEEAKETKKAAFTKYFPQVSASLTGVIAKDPMVEMDTSGGNLPVYNGNPATLPLATEFAYFPSTTTSMADRALVTALSAVQPLFVGGRIVSGNKLAKIGVEAAKEKSKMSKRDIAAETEEKYWRLAALKEKLRTLDAYENLLATMDKQVSDAVTAGLITRNDQLKVELKRKEVEIDRKRLEDGIRLSVRDLRRHIGLPEGDTIVIADKIAEPTDPANLKDSRKNAADRRPEIRLLEKAAEAEKLQISMKRGEMMPTVSVGGALYHMEVHGMEGDTNLMAFGTVNVPLSGIWEGVHNTVAQRKRKEIAESRLSDTKKLINLEIDKKWSDLDVAWQANQIFTDAMQQAEVNLFEAKDRYNNGMAPFSDVLEAEMLKQQVIDGNIDAKVDYQLKRSAYLRAIGIQAKKSSVKGEAVD